MVPGAWQLGEAGTHDATDDLAAGVDGGSPLIHGDLAGLKGLGATLAAQLAPAGGSQAARPLRLAVGRYQVTAALNLDRNDRHLAGHVSLGLTRGCQR